MRKLFGSAALPALTAALLGLTAPAAVASWGGPFILDPRGPEPNWRDEIVLESNRSGAALAAWTGPHIYSEPGAQTYVRATSRLPGQAFATPRHVAEQGRLVDAALNEKGEGVLLVDNRREPASLVFVTGAGEFSAPEPLSADFTFPRTELQAVEIDDRGNVLVISSDFSDESTGFVATWRSPAGEYEHSRHGDGLGRFGRFSLLSAPSGQMTLLANVVPTDGTGLSRIYALAGDTEMGLGPATPMSQWDHTAPYTWSWPQVAINPRGDIAALWGGTVRVKPAGEFWSDPEDVQGVEPETTIGGGNASVAIDEQGNVFAAWVGSVTLGRYRPAGGRFGPVEFLNRKRLGLVQTPRIWFDQAGNLLYAYHLDDGALHVRTRPPDGSAGEPHVIAPPGQPSVVLGKAPIEDGMDIFAWSRGVRTSYGYDPVDPALRLSAHKPDPPQPSPVVSRVVARAPALKLTVTENAVADVLLEQYRPGRLTGRRIARLNRALVPGRNRLPLSRRLRRKLKKAGEVRAVIAAIDRGGSRSREQHVVFRVR
jgi:hypothetical protein